MTLLLKVSSLIFDVILVIATSSFSIHFDAKVIDMFCQNGPQANGKWRAQFQLRFPSIADAGLTS